jgi:NAD(P)H-hydrate repair Nnr-like enzyme with NAD(P)H-hydrate epimerase domain
VTALPSWLIPLADAQTMRGVDRWAIEQQGVPGLELMERAGEGVARAVERLAADGPVTVVCGKGNNGADGLRTSTGWERPRPALALTSFPLACW